MSSLKTIIPLMLGHSLLFLLLLLSPGKSSFLLFPQLQLSGSCQAISFSFQFVVQTGVSSKRLNQCLIRI